MLTVLILGVFVVTPLVLLQVMELMEQATVVQKLRQALLPDLLQCLQKLNDASSSDLPSLLIFSSQFHPLFSSKMTSLDTINLSLIGSYTR